MSRKPIDRLRWAYNQRDLSGSEKAVLAYLAFLDGKQCSPSIRSIAEDCSIGRNTVKRALHSLEKIGLIERMERVSGNRQITSIYYLSYSDDPPVPPNDHKGLVGPQRAGGGSMVDRGVGPSRTHGGSTAAPPVGPQWATELEEQLEDEQEEQLEDEQVPERVGPEAPLLSPGKVAPGAPPGGDGGLSGEWWVDGPNLAFDPGVEGIEESREMRQAYFALIEKTNHRMAHNIAQDILKNHPDLDSGLGEFRRMVGSL